MLLEEAVHQPVVERAVGEADVSKQLRLDRRRPVVSPGCCQQFAQSIGCRSLVRDWHERHDAVFVGELLQIVTNLSARATDMPSKSGDSDLER